MGDFGHEWTPPPGFLYECESKGVVGKTFFKLIENTELPFFRMRCFSTLPCRFVGYWFQRGVQVLPRVAAPRYNKRSARRRRFGEFLTEKRIQEGDTLARKIWLDC